MSVQFSTLDELIVYARSVLTASSFDFRELTATVNKHSDSFLTEFDRYDKLCIDLENMEEALAHGKAFDIIRSEMWLFSAENDHYALEDVTSAPPLVEESYEDSGEDGSTDLWLAQLEHKTHGDRTKSFSVDEQDLFKSYQQEDTDSDTQPVRPHAAVPVEPTPLTSPPKVTPAPMKNGSGSNGSNTGVQQSTESAPVISVLDSAQNALSSGNFVTAFNTLKAIKTPEKVLSAEQLETYNTLKTQVSQARLEHQQERRNAVEEAIHDATQSLDELVKVFDALLNPEITLETEENEIRTLRAEFVNPEVWTPRKRERYLLYYRHVAMNDLPRRPLTYQYDWLRAEAPKLEKVVKSIDPIVDQDLFNDLSEFEDEMNKRRNRLQVDLGRILSVAIDRDYVGLIREYSSQNYRETDTLEYPPGSGKVMTIKVFLITIRREYAQYMLTASGRLFENTVEKGSELLESAKQTTASNPRIRFLKDVPLTQIAKNLKIALINLKPSEYLERFSDIDILGDRSLDPAPLSLDVDQERRQLVTLRDVYLPTAYAQYEQVIKALKSDRLKDLYDAMLIVPHADIKTRVKELEEREMQRVTTLRSEFDSDYETGAFWDDNQDEQNLQDYMAQKLSDLNRVMMLNIELPMEHPHYEVYAAHTRKVQEEISFFGETLPEQHKRLEDSKRRIQQQLTNIETELTSGEQVSAEDIRARLTNQRQRIQKLTSDFHYRNQKLLDWLLRLEALNSQKFNAKELLNQAKSDILAIYALKPQEMPTQAALSDRWGKIVAMLRDRFETINESASVQEREGYLLYLYAQAKMNYHLGMAQSVSESVQRQQLIDNAQRFLNRVVDPLDVTLYPDLSDLMDMRYLPPFRLLVEQEVERSQQMVTFGEDIRRSKQALRKSLQGVESAYERLRIYREHLKSLADDFNTLEEEIADKNASNDQAVILRSYIEGEFFDEFKQQVMKNVTLYLSEQPPNMELGEAIYQCLQSFQRITGNIQNLLSGHQLFESEVESRFRDSYRTSAEQYYRAAHEDLATPSLIVPFDLPLEGHNYDHWFEVANSSYSKHTRDSQKQRGVAEVAAYYLISHCVNEQGHGDVAALLEKIEQTADPQYIPTDRSEQEAMKHIRDARMLYILRDMVIFAHEQQLAALITQRDRKSEISEQIDAYEQQAAGQIEILKMDVQPEVALIGMLWQRRSDALVQFLTNQYVQVRRTLRNFAAETDSAKGGMFVVDAKVQERWTLLLRRRHAYIVEQMTQMYPQLIRIFTEEINKLEDGQDARLLKEKLDIAVFLTDLPGAPNQVAKVRGQQLLTQLAKDLGSIADVITGEFTEIVTKQLPASLEQATIQLQALSDNLEVTQEGLENITGIQDGFKDKYAKLYQRVSNTAAHMIKARNAMREGVEYLYKVVRNLDGVNLVDRWNTEWVYQHLTRATEQIEVAIGTAGITTLPQRGEKDYERFKRAVEQLVKNCATFVEKRKSINETLSQRAMVTLADFAQLEADCEEITALVELTDKALKDGFPDLSFSIPPGFFRTTILHKPSITNLPMLLDDPVIYERAHRIVEIYYGGVKGSAIDTWLTEWRQVNEHISKIDGDVHHYLVAVLMHERAIRWNKVIDQLREAYLKCYREWLDVGAWCAYYMPIFHELYAIHNLGDTAAPPDDQAFIGSAEYLLQSAMLKQSGVYGAPLRIQGAYKEIAREISEYEAERETLTRELNTFIHLVSIPRELVDLVKDKLRQFQDSQAEKLTQSQRKPESQYPLNFDPFAGVDWTVPPTYQKIMQTIIQAVEKWISDCDRLVDDPTHGLRVRRSLLENKSDEDNPTGYLTMLEQAIANYDYEIGRTGAWGGSRRRNLEQDRANLQRIYSLLARQ